MLGDSAVLGGGGGGNSGGAGEGGSGDAVAAVASGEGATAAGGGGGGSNSGDEERGRMVLEEGERSGSFGGNRWPRQETLALLRIRSDMDVAFRDASVKGPLWEDVSRKMAELGYERSAKKCKEKFENVYKYHKRTKEGRSGKADGKTYRFFDQLEAFENHPPPTTTHHHQSPKPPPPPSQVVTTTTMPMPPPHVTVPSTTTTTTTAPMVMPQGTITISTAPSINLTIPSYPPPTTTTINPTSLFPHSTPNPTTTATTNPLPHTTIPAVSFTIPTDLLSNSSSSSTSSDETPQEGGSRKRKRKWKDFFERLMKEVVEKQEQLQKRFLEAIEKREQDRMAREEAWRVQEMQRINREREILAQERSIAAAKDAAVMSFLHKIAEQQNLGQPLNTITILQPHQQQSQPQPQPVSVPQAPLSVQQQPSAAAPVVQPVVLAPQPQPPQQQQQVTGMEIVKVDNNNGENLMSSPSSSRWPKVEVQALIQLRTSLDAKYQENGPKGPLWEEISSSMRKLGYNRSSKRCKEKWENINKYFKKVKESNKKRPQDSKTCPYFHQLDALYREKNKLEGVTAAKPETMVAPLMVRPEQQWPPQPPDVAMEDAMDTHHHHQHDDDDEDTEDIIGDEEDDEDESGRGGGNNYEIVASKPASASSMAPE